MTHRRSARLPVAVALTAGTILFLLPFFLVLVGCLLFGAGFVLGAAGVFVWGRRTRRGPEFSSGGSMVRGEIPRHADGTAAETDLAGPFIPVRTFYDQELETA